MRNNPAPMIDVEYVKLIHEEIINNIGAGCVGSCNEGLLDSALYRIQQRMHYEGLRDIYVIAAWYGIAISTQHAFSDGNKRTGLTVMLTYLQLQGVIIESNQDLDDMMVDVVEAAQNSVDGHSRLALALGDYLYEYVTRL
ncbi:type II toxin-antitoxin system death-on-curing family toxin [Acinetobacter baumannii]